MDGEVKGGRGEKLSAVSMVQVALTEDIKRCPEAGVEVERK